MYSCCGVNCKECQYYVTRCNGCENIKGQVYWLVYTEEDVCPMYQCCIEKRQLKHCGQCNNLPCSLYENGDPTLSEEKKF